jgi:RNA polymerase sigma-70 factor (ECF subfamily)
VPTLTDTDQNPLLRDPDVRLMLRAKEGDSSSFNQLVLRYQDRLVGVLFHLVQDQQRAEDLAQEVFLRVYRARHGYEPTAKFSTWLFRIANNLASNSRRDQGRRREVNLAPAPNESGALGARPQEQLLAEKSGMMPQRIAAKSELQSVVQSALAGLNDNQRMAVLLHKFEEMSYVDIAASLELSPAAVKSLLSRARDNLREKLEPYFKQGLFGTLSGKPSEEDDA